MADIIFTILIVLEVYLTYVAVKKLLELEKKIIYTSEQVVVIAPQINKIHLLFQQTLHKINSVVAFLNSKRLNSVKNVISSIFSIIDLIIIFKSFNFKKGLKFNFKGIRKLLLSNVTREVIKKIIKYIEGLKEQSFTFCKKN